MKTVLQQGLKKNIELLKFIQVTSAQSSSPFMVGQCLMDHFDKSLHSISKVDLVYNIKSGIVSIDKSKSLPSTAGKHEESIKPDSHKAQRITKDASMEFSTVVSTDQEMEENQKDLRVYKDIYFEHSDSCPARKNRVVHEESNQEVPILNRTVKMAMCTYIMDKDNHILLTKRPSWLSIFPQAWVLPGGLLDLDEEFEYATLREIEEEVGITIEHNNNIPKNYFLSSPLNSDLDNPKRTNYPPSSFLSLNSSSSDNQPSVDFRPYYLYESVTKNIQDIDDHDSEQFPPKSQHLVLFFMAQINASWRQITLEPNPTEVEELAWVGMD